MTARNPVAARTTIAGFGSTMWRRAATMRDRPRSGHALLALMIYAAVVLVFYASGAGSTSLRNAMSDVTPLPLGALATAVALVAVKRTGRGSRLWWPWAFTAFAYTCWFLGDVQWLIYREFLRISPFPSLADAMYLAYYPLMLGALLTFPGRPLDREARLRFWLDAAIVMVGGGAVVWALVLAPTIAAGGDGPVKIGLSIAYPVGDLILLLGIAKAGLQRRDPRSGRPLVVLLVGLLGSLGGDVLFASQSLAGTYVGGDPATGLYTVMWACFAAAALLQVGGGASATAEDIAERPSGRITDVGSRDDERPRLSPLPLLAIVVGFGLLASIEGVDLTTLRGQVLVSALVLAGLVSARQVVAIRQHAKHIGRWAEQQSEARYRALVESTSDLVAVVGADGSIRFGTPSFARILGMEPDALVGTSIVQLVQPSDGARVVGAIASARLSGSPFALEVGAMASDGSVVEMEAVVSDFEAVPEIAGLVMTMRDVRERKRFEAELAHQSLYDALTGLPNRTLFADRVGQALARGARTAGRSAVLLIEITSLHRVTRSLGQEAENAFILEVARRISSVLRGADTAARFDTNTFGVLVEGSAGSVEAEEVASRLVGAIQTPIDLGTVQVTSTARIGIAESVDRRDVPVELLRRADAALGTTRLPGVPHVQRYQRGMEGAALDRLRLEAELRMAIERRELVLHYQPVFILETGALHGFEALVRWQHPTRGLLAPDAFIRLAEETGLIVPLGRFVLDEACRRATDWQYALGHDRPVCMAVNASARQLDEADFVADVAAALDRSGLPAHRLVIEITESILARDPESAKAQLRTLRDLGIRLAIDDFGTGYSSLAYLSELPVQTIKIDKRFVDACRAGSDQPSLLAPIVELGKVAGLNLVAEGIEQPEQVAFLRQLGVGMGQGFQLARPMDTESVERFLDDLRRVDALRA